MFSGEVLEMSQHIHVRWVEVEHESDITMNVYVFLGVDTVGDAWR